MKRDYYTEGQRAFAVGMTSRNNPYRYGLPRHEWQRGHTDAWWATPAGQAERERINRLHA